MFRVQNLWWNVIRPDPLCNSNWVESAFNINLLSDARHMKESCLCCWWIILIFHKFGFENLFIFVAIPTSKIRWIRAVLMEFADRVNFLLLLFCSFPEFSLSEAFSYELKLYKRLQFIPRMSFLVCGTIAAKRMK